MLTASDFHQSRTERQTGAVVTVVMSILAVYVTLVLSPTLADRKRLQQMPLNSFVGGLSLVLSFTTS